MNYLNKIQNIGFKRHKSVVLCDHDTYIDKIDGVYIADVTTIINYKKSSEYLKSKKEKYKTTRSYPSEAKSMRGGFYPILEKVKTYKWQLSYTLSIYISISGNSYIIFIDDTTLERTKHKYSKDVECVNNIMVVDCGDFNPDFWKKAMSYLPIKYKREVILKQLF